MKDGDCSKSLLAVNEFNNILNSELSHLAMMNDLYESVLVDSQIKVSEIMDRKKEHLKSFIMWIGAL